MVLAKLINCNIDNDTCHDTGSIIISNGVDNGRYDFRENTCKNSCRDSRAEPKDDISDFSRTVNNTDHSVGAGAAIVIGNGK